MAKTVLHFKGQKSKKNWSNDTYDVLP